MMFYELQPIYQCRDFLDITSTWETCKSDDFCAEGSTLEYKVDYANDLSIHNWIEEYDMQCAAKFKFGLFGSLFFIGVVISSLIFPPLADQVGRRPIALIGITMQAVASIGLLFSTSLIFTYSMIFVMGMAMAPRFFVGYVFSMEFLPQNYTAMATSITLAVDGLVLMWSSLYFMFIDNHWKSLYACAVVATFFAIAITMMQPESPKFLLSKGRYDEARKVITKIAKINRLTKFDTQEDEEHINSEGLLVYKAMFKDEL